MVISLPTLRHRKVAPAFCSCTTTQQSVRRRETPLVLLPASVSKNTNEDTFTPKYTSTGISDEDLDHTELTTNSTTLYIPASGEVAKRKFIAPVIELTDNSSRNLVYPEIQPDDTPINFLTYSTSEYVQKVASGQSKKSTLGKFINRNLTRGRTFLRKMRKPRSLPLSPADKKNERGVMKRSLPSMPGSYV